MEIDKQEKFICPTCGYIGESVRFSKGNYLVEIFLWTLLFVPGVFYTAWRAFNEYHACPVCKNQTMTPLDCALGKKMAEEKERLHRPITNKEASEILSKILKV